MFNYIIYIFIKEKKRNGATEDVIIVYSSCNMCGGKQNIENIWNFSSAL